MNTTSSLPHSINVFLTNVMLDRATPLLLHESFAQVRDLPKKSTSTQRFRKYAALATNTTALTEGVTPAGQDLSKTNIDIDVYQYGDYVTITDWLTDTSPDAVVLEATEILAEQMGESLDEIVRDAISTGTNVTYCDATSPAANSARNQITSDDVIDADGIRTAVTALKVALAKKIKGYVDANQGYGTTAVRPCYVGIIHPYTTDVLRELTGWKNAEDYRNATALMPGEVGSWGDVRFVETTKSKVFAGEGSGGIDVYSTLIIGKDAYGVSKISGEGARAYYKQLGSAGTEDPLNQRATVGWKATRGAGILQQLFMMRLEHAV